MNRSHSKIAHRLPLAECFHYIQCDCDYRIDEINERRKNRAMQTAEKFMEISERGYKFKAQYQHSVIFFSIL